MFQIEISHTHTHSPHCCTDSSSFILQIIVAPLETRRCQHLTIKPYLRSFTSLHFFSARSFSGQNPDYFLFFFPDLLDTLGTERGFESEELVRHTAWQIPSLVLPETACLVCLDLCNGNKKETGWKAGGTDSTAGRTDVGPFRVVKSEITCLSLWIKCRLRDVKAVEERHDGRVVWFGYFFAPKSPRKMKADWKQRPPPRHHFYLISHPGCRLNEWINWGKHKAKQSSLWLFNHPGLRSMFLHQCVKCWSSERSSGSDSHFRGRGKSNPERGRQEKGQIWSEM